MFDSQNVVRSLLSGVEVRIWRALQAIFLLLGIAVVAALLFAPPTGLHWLWNVLIPVAPALLVVAPGIWRNVCPMGTVSLLPRHLGLSKRRRLSASAQAWLMAGALVLLLGIVPLRRVIFDTHGPAIGLALVVVAVLALGLGFVLEWKSAWCSGLCPVYPVELLYGQAPLVSVRNAHCRSCDNCVAPCRDATADLNPANVNSLSPARWSGLTLAGGFPGFIIGWYQVPDYRGLEGFRHLHVAYGLPLAAMGISLVAFLGLRAALGPTREVLLVRIFAAAAIVSYYWFKLPAMLGLGAEPASALIDLHRALPPATTYVLRALTILFFGWLLVLRPHQHAVWAAKQAGSRGAN